MALLDPQSITINAVATSLPRTAFGTDSGAFRSSDGNMKLSVSHSYGKDIRSLLRFDHQKITPDTLRPDVNVLNGVRVYTVIQRPANGSYTATEVKQIVEAHNAKLSANSGALITQLLGGES